MSLNSRANAGRSLVDTVAFRAVLQPTTVLGYQVQLRAVAKDQLGVYSLLNAFIPVFSTLSSLGLNQVLRRNQPEFLVAGKYSAAARLVNLVPFGRLGTNLVLLAVILLAWGIVAPLFKLAPYRTVFVGFSVLILLFSQVRILQLAVASHLLHRYSVGSTALISMVKLLAYGALHLAGSLDLRAAIAVDTTALAVANAGLQFAYSRHV